MTWRAISPRRARTNRSRTSIARLDAAGNRVNALLYAAINFNQVLGGFYLQLNDEQKKQFDSVGRR